MIKKNKDIIAACVLIDNLVYPDSTIVSDVPGGAGLHALFGAALFSDQAILTTGVGEDFPDILGDWMDRNMLSGEGLRSAVEKTPRNALVYKSDHERTEESVYGLDHFAECEPTVQDIEKQMQSARSLYVFKNTDDKFWSEFSELNHDKKFKTLWEIALDACTPENLENISRICNLVDAISLNLEEASRIFEHFDEQAMLAELSKLPVEIVFLRVGARGSYVVSHGSHDLIPSLDIKPEDVTGGGNAYSGAALIGLVEGRSPIECARMGTVAATLAIQTSGAPEIHENEIKVKAMNMFNSLNNNKIMETKS